jgi:hypothetical protein
MKPILLLMLSIAVPVSASPVVFGMSYDGDPPGTFADITGAADISAGHADFAAGTYLISVTGGHSALYSQDTIGFEGDTVCAVSAVGCVLGKPGANQPATVLEVYLDRPWHLWGWSPAIGKVLATGPQFAFTQTGATTWSWGFEDLGAGGDYDYQDVLGTITFLHGIDPDPTPDPHDATPVPEPTTILLVAIGLMSARKAVSRSKP